MATQTGKSGHVYQNSVPVVSINNWDLTVTVDNRDHTVFSTSTGVQWRTFANGLSGWSGSFSGFFDTASTSQTDIVALILGTATGSVNLIADKAAGGSFTGNVNFAGMNASAAIDGDVEATYNFTGNGVLTYSTTT